MAMLTATAKTITSGRIYSRAMLVKLKVEVFGNTVSLPKEVVKEFADKHGADPRFFKFAQNKIDPSALETLLKSRGRLRTTHLYLTAPWSDEGFRILHVDGYDRYKAEMRGLLDDHRVNVRDFIDNIYETEVELHKSRINGLAKYIQYPTKAQLINEFSSGFTARELPRSNDFRCDLDAADIEEIVRTNASEDLATLEASARHGYREAAKLIGTMATRLRDYCRVEFVDPKTGRLKTRAVNGFQDTLVTNITEFLDILPGLNFTEDKELIALSDEIRKELTKFSAGDLKADDLTRERTCEKAQDILARLEAYV